MATVEVTRVPPVQAEKTFILTLTEREAEYVATALGSIRNHTDDIDVFHELSEAGARWGSRVISKNAARFFTSSRDEYGWLIISDKEEK